MAKVLYLDDDTVRSWRKLYDERGIAGLEQFDAGGSSSRLSLVQEEALKAYVAQTLPRTTRDIGAFIEREFGVVYESRAGLIALLHRLGLEYHKPEVIGRSSDAEKQQAFIAELREAAERARPRRSRAVRGCGASNPCRAAGWLLGAQGRPSGHRTNERAPASQYPRRFTLETGQTRMIEAETIDAASTIKLLESLEALYPMLAVIHVFLDNARYHHAKLVQDWLAQPGRRIQLHFIPAYCPHLNPIERLWGAMHKHVTHNKCYATSREFAGGSAHLLTRESPAELGRVCAMPSPTTSASSIQRIFGFWRERVYNIYT